MFVVREGLFDVVLRRSDGREVLPAPEEAKSIGLVGGAALASLELVDKPYLGKGHWFWSIFVLVVVAGLKTNQGDASHQQPGRTNDRLDASLSAASYMLIEAMRCMPGNHGFEQTIEFTNLASFYLPYEMYVATMVCYHVNSILNLMSLIIQLAVALICAPFAVRNLDDNVILQYLAVIGLSVMSVIWISLLVAEPTFPSPLPVATTAQSSLVGTVLFNFAFTSTLPSWVNEKKAEVSVGVTFWTVMGYVVVTYTVIGVVGGMAYPPFYTTDENLFSKLNAGGSRLGQATVAAYPMLQNVTSIPVLAILIRSNLIQGGLDSVTSTFIAVGLPWLMSIPLPLEGIPRACRA
ncbi:unnamed protein product [Symbiodinium sp. CCMP2456]|nr:unnamed protein product [Symbiodinium sp. CCMP2456]